jgi:uncharacterized protein YciI
LKRLAGLKKCPFVGLKLALSERWRPSVALARVEGYPVPMYALALIRYRRPIEEVVAHQDAHRAFQRQLKDEGKLIAAGPHDPRFGGMMLLRVDDDNAQKSLDAIRDADPYYQNGVVQYELLVWNVVIGKDGLDTL